MRWARQVWRQLAVGKPGWHRNRWKTRNRSENPGAPRLIGLADLYDQPFLFRINQGIETFARNQGH